MSTRDYNRSINGQLVSADETFDSTSSTPPFFPREQESRP
jgi:hypothetical protein